MSLKPKRLVKSVSIFTLKIAGKHKFVAVCIAALFESVFHHCTANNSSLEAWVNRNVLYYS